MTDLNLGSIRYATLCDEGTKLQTQIDMDLGRRRRVAYLLMAAETDHRTDVTRYRAELTELRDRIHDRRGRLLRHAAHCPAGCRRDTSGGLSGSAFTNHGAPMHSKPPLPGMSTLAARLRDGEALEAIAAEYDRTVDTIRQRLNAAGFSSRTGRANTRPTRAPRQTIQILPDEPWREEALCAQTDPEAFFPERGGSTRDAKSVCSTCTVTAECLAYALQHNERYGIWGGISERDRRKLNRHDKAAS